MLSAGTLLGHGRMVVPGPAYIYYLYTFYSLYAYDLHPAIIPVCFNVLHNMSGVCAACISVFPLCPCFNLCHCFNLMSFTVLNPVWLDQNQIWILKSRPWNHEVANKQNVKSESGSWKQMRNLDLAFIQISEFINFIQANFIKMSLFCFHSFYGHIMDYELIKQNVWSFDWLLLIAVRHLESNESAPGAGFQVSRIQIRF